jgi:DNA-binding NtrC family response regulator
MRDPGQAVLLCSENRITVEDLARRIVTSANPDQALRESSDGGMHLPAELLDRPLPEARARVVSAFERAYVGRLLGANRGRIGETAKQAGINQRHLFDLMKRLGLRKEDFKPTGN